MIAEVATKLGIGNIGDRFPDCWEWDVDAHWHLAINGHLEPKKSRSGVPVPPFHCYAEFNGFPAGMFTPYGGILAAGKQANEAALLRALRARLA